MQSPSQNDYEMQRAGRSCRELSQPASTYLVVMNSCQNGIHARGDYLQVCSDHLENVE